MRLYRQKIDAWRRKEEKEPIRVPLDIPLPKEPPPRTIDRRRNPHEDRQREGRIIVINLND